MRGGCVRTAIKLAAVLVSLAVSWSQNVPRKTAMNPEWNQVDRLVSEQKFEEAAALAAKIRVAAQKSGDDQEWTRALAREVQLRTALHGYETAVALLKGQPWPDGALN